MSNVLQKIDLQNFDLERIILDTSEVFSEVVEETLEIMRRSNAEPDSVFIGENFCEDLEELLEEIKDTDEEIILFLPFMIDPSEYEEDNILYLANKKQYSLDGKNYDYGDLKGTENGYLMIIKDSKIEVYKGDNGMLSPLQGGVKLVKSFGQFEKELVEYLNKFIIDENK